MRMSYPEQMMLVLQECISRTTQHMQRVAYSSWQSQSKLRTTCVFTTIYKRVLRFIRSIVYKGRIRNQRVSQNHRISYCSPLCSRECLYPSIITESPSTDHCASGKFLLLIQSFKISSGSSWSRHLLGPCLLMKFTQVRLMSYMHAHVHVELLLVSCGNPWDK